MNGAFLTSRELFGNPIWKNIVEFRLFFLIYGKAVFSEEGVRVSDELFLERGQWLRSTRKLQEDLTYIENRQVKTYSTSVINRCIKKLEREQRICTKTHELGTIFTVLNYEIYQGFGNYKNKNMEQNLEQHQNSVGTVLEQSGNNNKKENKENKVNKDNKHKEHIVEIINYLNAATGKSFSPDTKESIKLISGRLTEGKTMEQFKHVIDVKTGEWLNDEKMSAWLKPSTLFAQSNFESYLNQKRVIQGGASGGRSGKGNDRGHATLGANQAEWESLIVGSPTVRVQ